MKSFQREVREELEGREGPEFMPELMRHSDVPEDVDDLSRKIIGRAIEVHRQLGPGLLESIYEAALTYELTSIGICVERQIDIVIPYKTIELRGQRLDLLVGGVIIVELKSVTAVAEIHAAKLLSYLRAANKPLGLLFNFNTVLLRDGMRRVFNDRWKPVAVSTVPFLSPPPSSTSRSSR